MINPGDILRFAWQALRGYPVRTMLMLLAMSIGVAAVVLLTSLGEGARRYVMNKFASLGTNMIIVLPGRSETAGVAGNITGMTTRDLTLDDALALTRHPSVRRIAPINIGVANAKHQERQREVMIMGSNKDLLNIRHWKLARGKFLPAMDLSRSKPVCVIGGKIRKELFANKPALGKWLRIGDRRFRVIGIMASEGRSIGIDVGEIIMIPVASAQSLLNTPSLFRILVEAKSRSSIKTVVNFIEQTLQKRHQGKKDVTIVTQDAVLSTFDNILGTLTYAVAGIAAISLIVAGVLIMNVMLVAVSQRTSEIGLLKALGASRTSITLLFLSEAILLSFIGALLGLAIGQLASWGIRISFPTLPAYAPDWAIAMALFVSIFTGILFSLLPARRAAKQDPVTALGKK